MTYLLDVNVLIALIDPTHIVSAMTPLTAGFSASVRCHGQPARLRNGAIRIVGHPKYPNSTGSPAAVAPIVARLRALPGHVFWEADLSLLGSDLVEAAQIATPGQVTDT